MDPKMDPKCVVIQWDVYYKVVKILDNQKMMPAAFSMGIWESIHTLSPLMGCKSPPKWKNRGIEAASPF